MGRTLRLVLKLALAAAAASAAVAAETLELRDAYQDLFCSANAVVNPTTTAQVAAWFADSANAQYTSVRVGRSVFHSSSPFPCPRANATSAFLDLSGMNAILSLDNTTRLMRAQAGVKVGAVRTAAAAAKLSFPVGAMPVYPGLTLGGAFSTGAHGTAANLPSSLADITTEITWVTAAGAVRTSKAGSPEFRALAGGLGVVGVVTEIVFKLDPATLSRVNIKRGVSDASLAADVAAVVKKTPSTFVFWKPDLGVYTAASVTPLGPNNGSVPSYPCANVLNAAIDTDRTPGALLASDSDQLSMSPVSAYVDGLFADGTVKNIVFAVDATNASAPVNTCVAPTEQLVSSVDCAPATPGTSCAWAVGVRPLETEAAIPLAKLAPFIADVRRIVKELWTDRPASRNGASIIGGGAFIAFRFGRSSKNSMDMASGMKTPVYVIIASLTHASLNDVVPPRHGWVFEALQQLVICKYKGVPHPGKGSKRNFNMPGCPVAWKHLASVTALQAKLDPSRRLEPDLFRDRRTGVAYKSAPGCAARRDCFCTVDSDCPAPFPYAYIINPLSTPPMMGNATAVFKCVQATSVPGYTFGVCIPEAAP